MALQRKFLERPDVWKHQTKPLDKRAHADAETVIELKQLERKAQKRHNDGNTELFEKLRRLQQWKTVCDFVAERPAGQSTGVAPSSLGRPSRESAFLVQSRGRASTGGRPMLMLETPEERPATWGTSRISGYEPVRLSKLCSRGEDTVDHFPSRSELATSQAQRIARDILTPPCTRSSAWSPLSIPSLHPSSRATTPLHTSLTHEWRIFEQSPRSTDDPADDSVGSTVVNTARSTGPPVVPGLVLPPRLGTPYNTPPSKLERLDPALYAEISRPLPLCSRHKRALRCTARSRQCTGCRRECLSPLVDFALCATCAQREGRCSVCSRFNNERSPEAVRYTRSRQASIKEALASSQRKPRFGRTRTLTLLETD